MRQKLNERLVYIYPAIFSASGYTAHTSASPAFEQIFWVSLIAHIKCYQVFKVYKTIVNLEAKRAYSYDFVYIFIEYEYYFCVTDWKKFQLVFFGF